MTQPGRRPGFLLPLLVPLLLACRCVRGQDEAVGNWTPVVMMHGINGAASDYDAIVAGLRKVHPGQRLHVIRLYEKLSSFEPLWNQVPRIADDIRNATAAFGGRYHLLCHSQGGIVCRALAETMEDHRIDHFVSMAGVQQGIRGIPDEVRKYLPSWLDNFADDNVWRAFYTPLGQDISFANYWRDPAQQTAYQQHDAFLPVVDNDPRAARAPPAGAGDAASRKRNFLRLGEMHLFASPDDGVVYPWDSPLFSTVSSDNSNKTHVPMCEQPLYRDDWFGLRTLDERGGLHATVEPGVVHTGWLTRLDLFQRYLEPILR